MDEVKIMVGFVIHLTMSEKGNSAGLSSVKERNLNSEGVWVY